MQRHGTGGSFSYSPACLLASYQICNISIYRERDSLYWDVHNSLEFLCFKIGFVGVDRGSTAHKSVVRCDQVRRKLSKSRCCCHKTPFREYWHSVHLHMLCQNHTRSFYGGGLFAKQALPGVFRQPHLATTMAYLNEPMNAI